MSSPKKTRWLLPGCAILLVLILIGVLLGAPAVLALRLAGFRSEGRTADLLSHEEATLPPTIAWSARPTGTPATAAPYLDSAPASESDPIATPPAPLGPQQLEAVVVDIWFLSEPGRFSADQIFARRLERGEPVAGQVGYYIEYDEAGINAYLSTWFGQTISQAALIRNPYLDLKPSGAVVYADLDLEVGTQRVGGVFMLDASGKQLMLAGVDIEGRLYSTPPEGRIAELAAELESSANRALRELTFLDPAGRFVVQRISLEEERVQILAY